MDPDSPIVENPEAHLPPLYGDADDEEDGEGVGEVAAALQEGEGGLGHRVLHPEVGRVDEQVGEQEEQVCAAQPGQQGVENIRHRPDG